MISHLCAASMRAKPVKSEKSGNRRECTTYRKPEWLFSEEP
jgi:hypothetical protein